MITTQSFIKLLDILFTEKKTLTLANFGLS